MALITSTKEGFTSFKFNSVKKILKTREKEGTLDGMHTCVYTSRHTCLEDTYTT